MKYMGRIVTTLIIFILCLAARIYGTLYYGYSAGQLPYFFIVSLLISWWLGKQYDKVKFYSEKDVLTGLYNRRRIVQIFPKIIARMRKRSSQLHLFLFDVDDFKRINDTYGHETGDKVLKHVSSVLSSNAAKTDIVVRWAGDEFLIISPDSDEKSGEVLIHEINLAFEKLSLLLNIAVSVSIGSSSYPKDAEKLDALLHIADMKMYANKTKHKA